MANNSGGPHCLADGVTNAHILAVEVVLPDGSLAVLGGEERVEELARMLAGVEVTEAARSHAREMLERRTPAPAAKATRRRH